MGGGHAAGGSAGLAGLIDEHGESVLADLAQYYGLSLVDALRPGSGYSPRQLLVLISQLPLESRTAAQRRGGDHFVGWGVDRYMTAALIDAIQINTYLTGFSKTKKPEPFYRPKRGPQRGQQNPFQVMAAQRIAAARKAKEA